MEDTKYCQSCGIPLVKKDDFATNADNSLNDEYCIYCFKDGQFTSDCTMQEMIEQCLPYLCEFDPNLNEDQAKAMMEDLFPKLKRWKNK